MTIALFLVDPHFGSHPQQQQRWQQQHEQKDEDDDCRALREENELLRLKVEILLDMLAQKTAEADIMEADMLKMRNILANA